MLRRWGHDFPIDKGGGGCLTLSRLLGMGIFLAEIRNGQSTISENHVFYCTGKKNTQKRMPFPHAFMFHLPSCFGKKRQVVLLMDHGFIFIQAHRPLALILTAEHKHKINGKALALSSLP